MPRTAAALAESIELGLNPGAQVYVWRDGETVADAGAGMASADHPMTADTINHWLSAGKPVVAVAIALLKERGQVEYDAPVASYIPEFAQSGKEAVTVRHVLTHTGGFRTAEAADRLASREEVIAAIAAAPLEEDWVPGERAAYQPTAGWHVLGEVVRRVSGRPFMEFARSEIFEPLGMTDSWTALTPEVIERERGRLADMFLIRNGERRPHPRYAHDVTEEFSRPGSGLRAPAHDLGWFYRMLLGFGELDGVKLLTPESVAEITSPQRTGVADETFGVRMDWGLGVMLDNKDHGALAPYGYGPHASHRTFGHGGSQSSTAFADPEHRLVVAVAFNGMPGEPRHDRRLKRVTSAIYEDLGLV